MNNRTTLATPRFLAALDYAVRLHGADRRKDTPIPYPAHLLGVCALVLADGGGEDEAIAALLHDALEDHPADKNRETIVGRFGDVVLAIVEACTNEAVDPDGRPRLTWRERKARYGARLACAPAPVLRVALADKLDNARAILADYRELGEGLWLRFSAGGSDVLWYYHLLVEAFRQAGARGHLIDELTRTLAALEELVAANQG